MSFFFVAIISDAKRRLKKTTFLVSRTFSRLTEQLRARDLNFLHSEESVENSWVVCTLYMYRLLFEGVDRFQCTHRPHKCVSQEGLLSAFFISPISKLVPTIIRRCGDALNTSHDAPNALNNAFVSTKFVPLYFFRIFLQLNCSREDKK